MSVWAKCIVEELCVAVEEGATGALEDEEMEGEEEAPVAGANEIDILGLTAGDEDGDEDIEEEEEEGKGDEEEAPGVGADAVGVEVTGADGGEDGAPFTEGADVTDALGVAPLNATFLTTAPNSSAK